MVICSFFQQGRCKFGDRCKNEHPGNTSGFGGGNRFGALQGGGGGGGGGGGRFDSTTRRPGPEADRDNKYGLTAADIRNDLTPGKGRPEWIFSCYAPGRNAPIQLFGGAQREQSFEEMRAVHYAAMASGAAEKAIQEANNMYTEAEQQINLALNDPDAAIRYVLSGENEHPNRLDIIEGKTGPASDKGQSPFAQPSPLAQPQTSPFGQPSTVTQSPAFSQPPGFGQPAFGQPAATSGAQPGFRQSPGFGQSGFPQAQQGAGGGGFGQPAPSPFAQAANQNQPAGGGFGQFANQTTPASGFEQPAQNATPFSQRQPTAPFGQGPPPAPAASPFAAAGPGQPQSISPFGQPAPFAASAAPPQQPPTAAIAKSAFDRIVEKNLSGMPKLTGQTVRDPATKKLVRWKGQPVTYVSDDNPCYAHPDDPSVLIHIFFPDGPPAPAALKDSQGKDEEYTPEVEAAYKFAKQHGYFKGGIIPKVPPKTEWLSFDF